MEDYYEILEVSKNASSEIIEKAYRVLAKRYHPDMHEEEKKEWAEGEFKKISEAYEILSNQEKRKEYDMQIKKQEENNRIDYQKLLQEMEILKQKLAYYESEETQNKTEEEEYFVSSNIEQEQNFKETQGHNANNQRNNNNINNSNYKDYSYYNQNTYTYKKENIFTKIGKNILIVVLTVIIISIIGFILWLIPWTRQWLLEIYEENPVIKAILDIFIT